MWIAQRIVINFTESLQSLQTSSTQNNQTPITPNKSKNNESEIYSITKKLKNSYEIRNILQTKHANQQLELEITDAQLKIEKIIHWTCKQQLPDMLEANKSESSTVLKKLKRKNGEVLSLEDENRLLKKKNMIHFLKRFLNWKCISLAWNPTMRSIHRLKKRKQKKNQHN